MDMELEIFQQFKPDLIPAISDSVLKIAGKCHARGLIHMTYENIVYKEETPTKQATLLLDAVDKCITTDCNNFKVFIDILDDELPPACKKPLSEMRESLKSLRDRRIFRLYTDDKMSSENSVVDVAKSPIKTIKQKVQKDFTKPGQSNSSKTLAHSISTDSGVSIDSSVSDRDVSLLKLDSTQSEDLAPIKETPLNNNHHQSSGVTSTTSPPVFSSASSTMADRIRNLWLEAKQKEAVEISLKEDIEQLQDELDRTVREKQKAKEELRKKRREVAELTSALRSERRNTKDEIDGLKSRIADGEASREKQARHFSRQLLKQRSKYKDDILAYELAIDEKESIICELGSKVGYLDAALNQAIEEKEAAEQQLNEAESKMEFQRLKATFHLLKEFQARYDEEVVLKDANNKLKKEIMRLKFDNKQLVIITKEQKAVIHQKDKELAEEKRAACAHELISERRQSMQLQNENAQLKRQLSELQERVSATESLAKRSKTD